MDSPTLTLSERRAEAALARLKILVVNNDETIRKLIVDVLEKLGFMNAFPVTNGYESLDILRTKQIDLVITDWELKMSEDEYSGSDDASIQNEWGEFPPNNGANFVKGIRNGKGAHPFVPIIMLTGPTAPNAILYSRDAGVTEILIKPLNSRNLCNRIINIIDKPRSFVTSDAYKGPCRRRKQIAWGGREERRTRTIELIKFEEHKQS